MQRLYNAHTLIALGMIGILVIYGGEAAFLVMVLAILEISLSMDNAVVNASVLKNMTPLWQQRFMTWGIVIAVFGMPPGFSSADRSFRNAFECGRCLVNGAQFTCRLFPAFARRAPAHCFVWRYFPVAGRTCVSARRSA